MANSCASLTLATLVGAFACGGSSTDTSPQRACVPGASIACAGVAGCSGFQVCKADGSGFDSCQCGATQLDAGQADVLAVADAADADSAAPAFTPASLPGIALWLDAALGIVPEAGQPATVKRWLDQSGNNHTATATNGLAQIDLSAVAGRNAVVCPPPSGLFLSIDDHPTLQWGSGDFALAMVLKPNGRDDRAGPMLWQKPTSTVTLTFELTPSLDPRLLIGALSVTGTMPINNSFKLVVARGARMEIRTGAGTSSGQTNTQDISAPGVPVILCRPGSVSLSLAEVIAVKGAVSDADVAKLEGYLRTKYRL